MKISVIGLGSYGIALAKTFYANDNKVSIYSKFEDEVKSVSLKRENIALFKGVKIDKGIEIVNDLEKCIEKSKIIVIAVPTFAVRAMAKSISNYITKDQVICIASKGIEQKTNKLMSEVVFEETKCENICFLSGPSFAIDLAQRKEVGLIAASTSQEAALSVKVALENDYVFVNTLKDIIGIQVSSSVKNVFAILLGIVDGMKLSESTRASILTCVVNDLRIITEMLGGKPNTIFTYAGIGDLLLTTMSDKSRNYTFGKYVGSGMKPKVAMEKMKLKTIEGVHTLKAIYSILEKKEIEIKSITLLNKILNANVIESDILRNIKM